MPFLFIAPIIFSLSILQQRSAVDLLTYIFIINTHKSEQETSKNLIWFSYLNIALFGEANMNYSVHADQTLCTKKKKYFILILKTDAVLFAAKYLHSV